MLTIRDFGRNKKGEAAKLYSFVNKNGMEMHVSDFGCTLYALMVPDKDGNKRDVVLGYDEPLQYEGPSGTFFGAAVGRNANRIGEATFKINGKMYKIDANDGRNNLHSGYDFWSYRVWDVKETTENSITFALHSPDGDQGFPGALDVTITYTLTDENSVVLEYWALPDADTILNLTNHSYWNLDGHASGNVRHQKVWLDADCFVPTDKGLIPTGEILLVEGTPMDFRAKKPIGQDIDADYEALVIGKGYDHNWKLKNDGKFMKVAELTSDNSGITMEVFTDRPGLQIYTANYVNNETGKHGVVYGENDGICFETQCFPNAINQKNFPSPICRKGEEFKSRTEYKFVV